MIGYLNGVLSVPLRVVLFAAGILFFVPGYVSDATGMLLLVAVIAWQGFRAKRAAASAPPAAEAHGEKKHG